MEVKHLLSESATWITDSEFIDRDGKVSEGEGQSEIKVDGDVITNRSHVIVGDEMILNDYVIVKKSGRDFDFTSDNPSLGKQRGKFHLSGDTMFSKFIVEGTDMNGFEIITRDDKICYAEGALYDNDEIINTWAAVMTKK